MADVPVPSEAERSPPASQVTLAEQTGSRDVQAPTTTAAPPADSVDLGQTRKSPASWFQLSGTPTGTSPTVKHSLLAMVPSQPLSRPSSATPPSPAPKLQPPSITAFTQPALPVPAASEPASAAASVPQQDSKEQQQHTASPTRAVAKQEQQASPQQGDPVAIGQSQHETEQQISNKKLRRDKRIQKTAATMHWQLMRRLADISTDVEMLNHEVARIKCEQSNALVTEDQKDLGQEEQRQLEILRQKRWTDLITRQCSTVLKSVQSHKWAFPFAKPVDTTIFKDYPIVITQPIDFATIKAKVDGTRYKQPQQFHADMKLVFANAKRYNPPGSDVNLMASGVEEKFDERWQAVLVPKLAEEDMHARTDEAAVRRQRLDKAQARLAGELEQHRLRLSTAFDSLHSAILDAKSLAAAACKPVSHRHKEALIPALDALTGEQFEWAMSLVHARYPGLPSGPGEEMQFDITCLDSLALRQLMDFTQACAKAAQGTDGSETQVTWPSNPVGVGSRGHKPLPNKRARRSPTPNPPDPPAILQPPQPHVTQANLQMSQPHHQAPQPSHTGSQPHLLAPLRNRSGPQPNLTAAQPDFQASQVPPAIGSQPTQSRPAAATALSLQTGVVLPGQVNSSLQQPSSQQQAAAFSAAAPEAQPAPYKPVQAPRLVDDTSLQPVLQHNPASNTQVLGPQHTSAHPMLHAQAPLGSTSADQLASLHSSARPLSQDSAAPTAALSSHSAQGLTTAQQQVAGTAQHMTAAAEAAVPLDARAETAAAPQSHQALTASMPSPQPASQAVATLPAPLASVQANNSPGVVAAMSGSAIGARSEGEGLSHSEAGQKRELGEMGDMSAEQQQDRDLLGTSVARQQAPAVQDVPVPKRARLEERFTGGAPQPLPAQQIPISHAQTQSADLQASVQQQLQQRPTTTDQEGSQHEQPGPSQLNTDLHLTTVVSQPQHSMHQAPSSQQLHQQTPALQSDAACSSEVTASRDEQTEYNSGQHAADSPPAQQAHHDAQEPSLHQAPSTQTEHGEDPNSEEADERRQLPRQSQDQANTLARRSAESEQQEAEPLVKHQAEVDAGSQNSEEDNSDQEEEEEEPEPQPKPMSKLEAYRARGRKGKGAGYVKQDVRQSQRKASRSRKSIAAADGSAGRGRKTSRGRASTPAARAASAQKPQRTTSRKTAGKRRQSPS